MKGLPRSAWIFIGWLLIFTLIPFLMIFGMSFLTKGIYGGYEYVFTFENYIRSFHWVYARVLLKTIALAGVATLSCLLVGFPVAYFLARSQGAMKQAGLVLLFIPFWTNFILRVYGIISLAGNNGLINQLLLRLGWIDKPVQILYSHLGIYIGLVYNYLPFLVVPIFSALEKLDPSFREAAQDLGANRIQTFWKVVLPNIREGVIVGSLFVFIPMMGEYVIPDMLGGARELFLGNIMVNQFFTMQDWPFGSSIAALLSLILFVAVYFQSRGGLSRWV